MNKKDSLDEFKDRALYFQEISLVKSPLLLFPQQLEKIGFIGWEDPTDTCLSFAECLSTLESEVAKSRASFIKMQCSQIDTREFFEQSRESWGIPKFKEDLLTLDDFRSGFLYTFRDHSTSWSENNEARNWFFTNIEARSVKHYQFWICDNGPEEVIVNLIGDYKIILWAIINDHQDYSALISPVFTKKDLQHFCNTFDEEKQEYYKEELLKIIEENPNW